MYTPPPPDEDDDYMIATSISKLYGRDITQVMALSAQGLRNATNEVINRIFSVHSELKFQAVGGANESPVKWKFSLLADWSREAWTILVSRLNSRGLPVSSDFNEDAEDDHSASHWHYLCRSKLFEYIMKSFRSRVDLAILWLTEEWYAEVGLHSLSQSSEELQPTKQLTVYYFWAERLLQGIVPSLEWNDRAIFLRFISLLPYLSNAMLAEVESLCLDPDKSKLGFMSLQYLLMYKPPARAESLQVLERIQAKGKNEDFRTFVVS